MFSFRKFFFVLPVDDIESKLKENLSLATQVAELSEKLDSALCAHCGPNKPKLREMSQKLKALT